MKIQRTKSIYILILSMLAVFAAGCGSQDAAISKSITIYSGRSESLVGPLLEQFENSSGMKVQVRYGSTAELAATILEEGENSPADIFFAQDPGGLGAVANAGLLAPLADNIVSGVEPRFVDADNRWVGVSGRARVVVYNTDSLSPEDLPDDLMGFMDPKWKGRIGLPPTNSSFQTMVTALRQAWGEEQTRAWLLGIIANQPVYYESNTPTVAAVAAGEIEVGFVNHYYLYRFLAEEGESFAARNYFLPGGGPGSLVMVSGVGRLKSSTKQDYADQFIEFLLSDYAQQYFAEQTFEYPLIQGIPPFVDLVPLAELNTYEISLEDLSDLQGTVQLLQDVGMLP